MRLTARKVVRVATVLGALVAGACARRDLRVVDSWMPLAVGNEWTYEQTGMKTQPSQTFRIVAQALGDRGEERFFVDDSRERYYVRDGVRQIVGYAASVGIWSVYLRGPITLGTRYDGGLTTNEGFFMKGTSSAAIEPRRAKDEMLPIPSQGYKIVTSFDRSVTVPAGTFPHCLEVTHVAGGVIGVKYFAAHVGLVLSEGWIEARGKRVMLSRQALTSYRIATEGSP